MIKLFSEWSTNETVDVICIGDIYPGRNVENKSLGLGYSFPFDQIGDHLTCDILTGNLEGVVDDIYGTQLRLKTTPRLSMSSSWLKELRRLGLGVVTVANNHFNDYGVAGSKNTIKCCHENDIAVVGVDDNEYKMKRLEVNGIKVGIIGCIDDTMFNDERCKGLCKASMIVDFCKSAKAGIDVLICHVHTGKEYSKIQTQYQIDLAHALVDAGVDVVAMHHPHVVQPVEAYKGSIIAYSLGNWIFDQDQPGTQIGLSLKVTLDKRGVVGYKTSKHTINDYIINYEPWQ